MPTTKKPNVGALAGAVVLAVACGSGIALWSNSRVATHPKTAPQQETALGVKAVPSDLSPVQAPELVMPFHDMTVTVAAQSREPEKLIATVPTKTESLAANPKVETPKAESKPFVPPSLERAAAPMQAADPAPVMAPVELALSARSLPVPVAAAAPVVLLADRPLTLIKLIKPLYPAAARSESLSGSVQVEAGIDEDGNVDLVRSLAGHPILVEAASAAIRRWTYQGAIANGKAVRSTTVVRLNFKAPE